MRTSTGVGLGGGKVDALGRRSWSLYQRRRIVAEALAPQASVAEVARRHGLHADRRRALVTRSKPMTFIPVEVIKETGGKEAAAAARTLTIYHVVQARTQNLPGRSLRKPQREAKGLARRGARSLRKPQNGLRVAAPLRSACRMARWSASTLKSMRRRCASCFQR